MKKEEIVSLIKDLIEKTTVETTEITISEDKSNNTWFSVEVKQPHYFIDRGGEALFALNHLVRRIVESKIPRTEVSVAQAEEGPVIMIDVNGFQKKRIENIHTIAHTMAERARYFKSSIEIDPMPSFDRRIVHEFLSGETDLKTESEGFGPSRRVVIKYIGAI